MMLFLAVCTIGTFASTFASTTECMEGFSGNVDNLDHSTAAFCDAINEYATCIANDGTAPGYLLAAAQSLLKVHQDKELHCRGEVGGRSQRYHTKC